MCVCVYVCVCVCVCVCALTARVLMADLRTRHSLQGDTFGVGIALLTADRADDSATAHAR